MYFISINFSPELENIDITDIETDTYCIIDIVYPSLHFKKDKTKSIQQKITYIRNVSWFVLT